VGGYPLPPDLNLTVASVTQAIEALGPNVTLATIKLDAFKAHFISEGEAEKVLAPMEHALACKRKASEMSIDDIKDSAPATLASATAAPAKKSHKKKV